MNKPSFIPEFEALRGWLALWVFVGHYLHVVVSEGVFHEDEITSGLVKVLWNPRFAVDVFVLLSGFVITGVIESKTFSTRQFFTRRFLRIYPLYAMACSLGLATVLLQADVFGDTSEKLDSIRANLGTHCLAHMFLIHGMIPERYLPYSATAILGPAWSISLEWQFYCVAPFVLRVFKQWLRPIAICAFPIVMIGRFNYLPADRIGSFLTSHIEFFVGGIVSYYVYHSLNIPKDRARVLGVVLITSVGFCPEAVHLVYRSDLLILDSWFPLMIWIAMMMAISASGDAGNDILGRAYSVVFLSQPVQWMGMHSYSFYLNHELVLIWMAMGFKALGIPIGIFGGSVFCVAAMISTLAASGLTYRWIERPAISYGRSLGFSGR